MRCFARLSDYFACTVVLVFFLTFNVYPAGLNLGNRLREKSVFHSKSEVLSLSGCDHDSRYIGSELKVSIANDKLRLFHHYFEYSSAGVDTVETFEIEFEDEGEKKGSWKELAAFLIVTGIVAYVVIVMIQPDEEEEKDKLPAGGKGGPVPFAGFSIFF